MSIGTAPMQGGPVLPAISEFHRQTDPSHSQFRPLYAGLPVSATASQLPGFSGSPPSQMLKRQASQTPLAEESPAKKQSKWTPEEDNLTIELRGQGMKWDDIAKRLPGRSSISCRLRYQNYLEKRAVWDEEKKNKLARLYARFKDQMWQKVATEMGIPWRSAESMHWQLGEQEMSSRANAPVFHLHPSATGLNSPPPGHATPAPQPHSFTPANANQLVPNPPHPLPPQHQQYPPQSLHHQAPPPPSPMTGPMQGYHRRAGSGSSQGRRKDGSSSRRRADPRSRSSVPPQLGSNALPRIQPTTEADLVSGAQTAPILARLSGFKNEKEDEGPPDFFMKRRWEEVSQSLRPDVERGSQGGHSPDHSSQRSGTGSVKSVKREEQDDRAQAPNNSSPSAS